MSPLPPPLRPLPLGRREQRVDLVIAAGVFVLALVSVALSAIGGLWGAAQAPLAVGIAYAAVLAAPLALRRRWPGIVTAIVSAAYFVAVTAHIPEVLVGNIAVFLAFYSIGAWTPNRRRANLVRAAIVVAMFAWLVVSMFEAATTATSTDVPQGVALSPAIAQVLLSVLINVLYFGAAWGFGDRAWTAGVQRRVLEERTAELEREREVTASQAVALERVRIARELHDVVAHHVSLMGVQAGVARTVMASDPALATTSLTQVEGSARSALAELRQLLETLRTSPDADAAPQPSLSLDAIETLVTNAAAAGLPTTLTTVGAPCEVPDLVQVNLVRIAQEALTNARRHGGHDATADVRLRFEADAVELEVANTGRVAASVTPGLGMVGMRERVTVSGGTLELIPRTGGGFIVRARVPLARVEQTP